MLRENRCGKKRLGALHCYTLARTHTRMRTHIHTHSHTHTCTHTYTHAHIGTHTHKPSHTYMHTCMHTHSHTYMHAHTLTHAHSHTRTHARARTHTHTCTHAYTQSSLVVHQDMKFDKLLSGRRLKNVRDLSQIDRVFSCLRMPLTSNTGTLRMPHSTHVILTSNTGTMLTQDVFAKKKRQQLRMFRFQLKVCSVGICSSNGCFDMRK